MPNHDVAEESSSGIFSATQKPYYVGKYWKLDLIIGLVVLVITVISVGIYCTFFTDTSDSLPVNETTAIESSSEVPETSPSSVVPTVAARFNFARFNNCKFVAKDFVAAHLPAMTLGVNSNNTIGRAVTDVTVHGKNYLVDECDYRVTSAVNYGNYEFLINKYSQNHRYVSYDDFTELFEKWLPPGAPLTHSAMTINRYKAHSIVVDLGSGNNPWVVYCGVFTMGTLFVFHRLGQASSIDDQCSKVPEFVRSIVH